MQYYHLVIFPFSWYLFFFFWSLRSDYIFLFFFFLVNCFTDSSPPSIMIPLVRLSMPGVLLFLISFVFFLIFFLTSDVMIDGTSDESWLVIFSGRCWSWGVQFCVKACADLQYFFSICLYFIFFIVHFTYLFLWSALVYMFWSSTTLKYSFNMTCPFLS